VWTDVLSLDDPVEVDYGTMEKLFCRSAAAAPSKDGKKEAQKETAPTEVLFQRYLLLENL
jgi:hypothetical protein